jgi:hypothetical protein
MYPHTAMTIRIFSSLSILIYAQSAQASEPTETHDESLVTDRPDVAESSTTVGSMRVQIETGLAVGQLEQASAKTLSTPTKVRIGLSESTELHLEGELFNFNRSSTGSDKIGVGNINIGGKAHFVEGDGLIPSIGLLLSFTLPLAAEPAFGDDLFSAHPIFALDWDMPYGLSLGLNIGLFVPLDDFSKHPLSVDYALALGYSIDMVVEDLGVFAECFGDTTLDEAASTLHFDAGFTYLLSAQMQIDVSLRSSVLHGEDDKLGLGLGFAFRI